MQSQASLFDWSAGTLPVQPARKTPRPYQLLALAGIREKLATHQSTLLVLATGMGKTVVAAHAAMEAHGRVLFLAHLDTLVSQSIHELADITGQPWEREQGEDWATLNSTRNVVASIQSLMRPGRFDRFKQDAFALVIVDEAHHYLAASYIKPIRYFLQGGAKVLGMTATPDRKDGKAMGRLFLSEAVESPMDIGYGVDNAWLALPMRDPIITEVSLDKVKTSRVTGDLDQGALDDEIAAIIAPIVKVAMEKCGERRTIVFTPGVKAAHAGAEAMNRLRPGCARSIDGMMPSLVKRGVIRDHKAGQFQYLFNCGVLVEGYDDAEVICMIDAAPTKSRSRCAQKVGRITRLWPGIGGIADLDERKAAIAASPKPTALWIDLVFNGSRHDIATPVDVLGGRYSDKERTKAKKILAKTGGKGDVMAILAEARRRCAAEALRAEVRLKEQGLINPLKRGRKSIPEPTATASPGRRAHALREFGFTVPAEWTNAETSKFIAYEYACRTKGLCNWERREKLARYGIPAKGMSVAKGAKLWNALKRNNWLRLSTDQYYQALATPDAGSEG